jgi:flagellar hook-basal body complex protein FliE
MPGPVGPAAAAIAAYRAAQSMPVGEAATATGGFGAALQNALEGSVQSLRTADATSGAALLGQAGVTETVLAVTRAELALQTAVALRDRVVAAYQDIMRMPI